MSNEYCASLIRLALAQEYDKRVKGNVYVLGGGPGYKMQFPADDRKALGLVQPILVLQVLLPTGQPFSFEVSVTDVSGTRRRLIFSKAFSEVKETPLHCQLPLTTCKEDEWANLALDLPSLVATHFNGARFKSSESVSIGASCKLRKIFTLRDHPRDPSLASTDPLPRNADFPPGVHPRPPLVLVETEQAPRAPALSFHSDKRPISEPPAYRSRHNASSHVAFGSTLSTRSPPEAQQQGRATSSRPAQRAEATRPQTEGGVDKRQRSPNRSPARLIRSGGVAPLDAPGPASPQTSETRSGNAGLPLGPASARRQRSAVRSNNELLAGAQASAWERVEGDDGDEVARDVRNSFEEGYALGSPRRGDEDPFADHDEMPLSSSSPRRAGEAMPPESVNGSSGGGGAGSESEKDDDEPRKESPRWPGEQTGADVDSLGPEGHDDDDDTEPIVQRRGGERYTAVEEEDELLARQLSGNSMRLVLGDDGEWEERGAPSEGVASSAEEEKGPKREEDKAEQSESEAGSEELPTPEPAKGESDEEGRLYTPPIIPASRVGESPVRRAHGERGRSSEQRMERRPPSSRSKRCSEEKGEGQADGEDSGLLDLMYDPILGLYFDPVSLRYYELRS